MRKIRIFSLIILTILALVVSFPKQSMNEGIVRKGQVMVDEFKMFDSITETINNNNYIKTAKKKVSAKYLSGFESVSLTNEDEYIITYEVVFNVDNYNVTLNVFFEITGEVIIENFEGFSMKNYNDEQDILFNIDGEHIFLSEIQNLSGIEQCSLFGNILHKSLNAGLLASSYLEPAIDILVLTNKEITNLITKSIVDIDQKRNYNYNKELPQPSGFVYGQKKYADWKFGYSNLSYAGCEVIAGYNVAKALGKNYTLAQVVLLYEALGIEIGAAQGYFGSNPYQISYFLKSTGISYTRVNNYKTFESKMKYSKDCYVILSLWTDESADSMIHTFMIDKENGRDAKFYVYNYKGSQTAVKKFSDYTSLFAGDIKDTYICAYFIDKDK